MRDFDEIDIGQGDSDIIFADLDHDGDGKINFEDFRSVLIMIFTYFDMGQKSQFYLFQCQNPSIKGRGAVLPLFRKVFVDNSSRVNCFLFQFWVQRFPHTRVPERKYSGGFISEAVPEKNTFLLSIAQTNLNCAIVAEMHNCS